MSQRPVEGNDLVTLNTRKNYDALLERVWGKMIEGHSILEEVDDSQLPTAKRALDMITILYLEERGSVVVRLRYGLTDGRRRTQAEVGRELGLSRTTIGRIEARAIRSLSHPNLSRMLLEAVPPVRIDGHGENRSGLGCCR